MKYTSAALKSIESAFGTMKHFWECQAIEMDNLEACSKKIEKVMKKVAREDPAQRDELKASLEQRIRESGTRWFAVFRYELEYLIVNQTHGCFTEGYYYCEMGLFVDPKSRDFRDFFEDFWDFFY